MIIVIERDYARPECFRENYIGAPCQTFSEAEELAKVHACEIREPAELHVTYVHNGTRMILTSTTTGEILREYAIQMIDFD